jgi:hypothetical protein
MSGDSLEEEMQRLESSYRDEDMMYDARAIARAESAQIMSQKFAQRDMMKQQLVEESRQKRVRKCIKKQKTAQNWQAKMKRSPFMVDLLAENERIDEDNKVRVREESRREKSLGKQKNAVKNEIVLKAIAETSDLDALRREKRAIQMEEKRLKALLDLEKTNGHAKLDLLAAQRAERQRKQAVIDYKRNLVRVCARVDRLRCRFC